MTLSRRAACRACCCETGAPIVASAIWTPPCSRSDRASSRAYVHTPPTVSVVIKIFMSFRASHHDQGFEKSVRPLAGHVERFTQSLEREAVREQRRRIEPPRGDRVGRREHAAAIDLWVALVGV